MTSLIFNDVDNNTVENLLNNKGQILELFQAFNDFESKKEIKRKDIREATRYLVSSFRDEEISKVHFEELIKILLSTYFKLKLNEKLAKKKSKLYQTVFSPY